MADPNRNFDKSAPSGPYNVKDSRGIFGTHEGTSGVIDCTGRQASLAFNGLTLTASTIDNAGNDIEVVVHGGLDADLDENVQVNADGRTVEIELHESVITGARLQEVIEENTSQRAQLQLLFNKTGTGDNNEIPQGRFYEGVMLRSAFADGNPVTVSFTAISTPDPDNPPAATLGWTAGSRTLAIGYPGSGMTGEEFAALLDANAADLENVIIYDKSAAADRASSNPADISLPSPGSIKLTGGRDYVRVERVDILEDGSIQFVPEGGEDADAVTYEFLKGATVLMRFDKILAPGSGQTRPKVTLFGHNTAAE